MVSCHKLQTALSLWNARDTDFRRVWTVLMTAEETMKEYWNKTRDDALFWGGAWVTHELRLGFIPLMFCWGQTILWASLRLTHLAITILVSSEYQGFQIWEPIKADCCFTDKLNERVCSASSCSRELVILFTFIHSVCYIVCLWSYPVGSGSKWGLNFIHTYSPSKAISQSLPV